MILLPGIKQDVDALAFSPDGKRLAVGGTAAHLQLWDLETRRARPVLGPNGPHRAVFFLGDGSLLTATGGGELRTTALPTGDPVRYTVAGVNLLDAAPALSDRVLVLCGQREWRPWLECRGFPSFDQRWTARPERHPFRLCPCPDGLLVGGTHHVWLLDPATGQESRRIISHHEAVPALAISPDGSLLAVAAGTELQTVPLASGTGGARTKNVGRKHFTDVAFHPSGQFLMASSNNQTVRFYSVPDLAETAAFDWEIGPVPRVAFAPDGMRAAAAGRTGKVVVWDMDW